MLRNLKACRCGGRCFRKVEGRPDGVMQQNGERAMRYATTAHECQACGARLHTAKVYAVPVAAPRWLATYNRTSKAWDVTIGYRLDAMVWIDEALDYTAAQLIGVDAVAKVVNDGYSPREVAAERAASKAWDAQYHAETALAYAHALPTVLAGVQVDELMEADVWSWDEAQHKELVDEIRRVAA